MSRGPRERKERVPPPLTEAWLRDQARRHLDRYWPSVAQLRRVLMRRVDRNLRFHGGDRDDGAALVDAILADLQTRGVLDDLKFARAWVEDLNRRGSSRMAIRHKLRQKGVPGDVVKQALGELDGRLREPDLAAACLYVRKRRFGPMRTDPEKRKARREKDLAGLGRAGFRMDVALRALNCADVDALRELCESAGGEWR